jgi:hypothetical protein
MPEPLAGRFNSDVLALSGWRAGLLVWDAFLIPDGWAACARALFAGASFFPSLVPAAAPPVFPTLLTSPRAGRLRVAALVARVALDFFVTRAFFGLSRATSAVVNAADLARVTRVVPAFSSFSFVTPRCLVDRTPWDVLEMSYDAVRCLGFAISQREGGNAMRW